MKIANGHLYTILLSSSRASMIRSRSLLSTTKIKPFVEGEGEDIW